MVLIRLASIGLGCLVLGFGADEIDAALRHLRDVVATNVASIYDHLLGRALHALLNPFYGRGQLPIIAAGLRGIDVDNQAVRGIR